MSGGADTKMVQDAYPGIDHLDVLEEAVHYNRFLVERIVETSGGSTSALDYGAGTGTLAVQVRDRGLDVVCVELDPGLQERLRHKGFLVHRDLTTVDDGSYAFVYSINVLEHIADDEGALAGLYSKLGPGGRVLLYVPAFPLLYSSMDEKVGHHRRYRMNVLEELAERAGFEIERAEYADSLGFFLTLLYKAIGSRQGDISRRPVRIYDRFLFPLSRILDRVGVSRLLGKNLVMTLRRPMP